MSRMKTFVLQVIYPEGDRDEYDGFVVRAVDETNARGIAEKEAAKTDPVGRWTDPTRSSCVDVDALEGGVALSSFVNG